MGCIAVRSCLVVRGLGGCSPIFLFLSLRTRALQFFIQRCNLNLQIVDHADVGIRPSMDDPCRRCCEGEEPDQSDRESMARVAPHEQPEGERDQAKAREDYHCGNCRRGHEPPDLTAKSSHVPIAAGPLREPYTQAAGAVELLNRFPPCTVRALTFTGYCG